MVSFFRGDHGDINDTTSSALARASARLDWSHDMTEPQDLLILPGWGLAPFSSATEVGCVSKEPLVLGFRSSCKEW